jgi:hypothetical protein
MSQVKPVKLASGGNLTNTDPTADDITFRSLTAGTGGLSTSGNFTSSGTGTFDFGSTGDVTASGNPSFDFGTGDATFGGSLAQSGGAFTLTGSGASTITTSSGALTLTSAAGASWGTAAGALNLVASGGGATARVHITATSTDSVDAIQLNASAGGIAILSTKGIAIDNSTTNGNISVNNTVGNLNIGNDADNFPINIGTNGVRVITIGNNTSGTGINLTAGTGTIAQTALLSTFSGNVAISGNLSVLGTTFSTNSETINLADNHIYLNAGYVTNTPQTGGLVINYSPTAIATTVSGSAFTAGVLGVSNPTVEVATTAGFAPGNLIQIAGATDLDNDGLYEVNALLAAPARLQIRGVGTAGTVEDFTKNQFVTEGTAAGSVTKVAVAVLRVGTDGVFETASGNATPLTFTDISGQTSLHQAYQNDLDGTHATITTDATDGDVVIGGTEKLRVTANSGFQVGAVAAERPVALYTTTFDIAGTSTTTIGTSGDIVLNSSGATNFITAKLGTATNATAFRVRDSADETQFSINGVGDIDASPTATNTLNVPPGTRFKVNNVALTTANFTAANLDILLNGSNADSLHTHAALTADIRVTVTAGETITTGSAVYMDGAVTKVKNANAAAIATGRFLGIYEGAGAVLDDSISVTIQGVASAPRIEGGGAFTVGEPVYVSAAGGADVGSFTTTVPSGSGTVVAEVGLAHTTTAFVIQVKSPVVLS